MALLSTDGKRGERKSQHNFVSKHYSEIHLWTHFLSAYFLLSLLGPIPLHEALI